MEEITGIIGGNGITFLDMDIEGIDRFVLQSKSEVLVKERVYNRRKMVLMEHGVRKEKTKLTVPFRWAEATLV